MKNSLATWHYPHRSMANNITYFANHGFPAVSIHGRRLAEALQRGEGETLARAVKESSVTLTVHGTMPRRLDEASVATYHLDLDLIGAWQKTYGLIHILSFDVPAPVRAHITPYLQEALLKVPNCYIAVEDFGICEEELAQLEDYRQEPRFGYLVDVGHMFIRMRGHRDDGKRLFSHAPMESPRVENPTWQDFKNALLAKDFPILEMHLHNNDGLRDMHLFLEDGEMDISAVAQALREIDYRGVLTIESAPGYQFDCYGKDADEGILRTYGYWKGLF